MFDPPLTPPDRGPSAAGTIASYPQQYLPSSLWPGQPDQSLSNELLSLPAEAVAEELLGVSQQLVGHPWTRAVQALHALLHRAQEADPRLLGDDVLAEVGRDLPLLLKTGMDRFGTGYLEWYRSNGLLHPAHYLEYTRKSEASLRGARAPHRLVHIPDLAMAQTSGGNDKWRRHKGLFLCLALHAVNQYVHAFRRAFWVRHYDSDVRTRLLSPADAAEAGLALVVSPSDISGVRRERALVEATSSALCQEALAWERKNASRGA